MNSFNLKSYLSSNIDIEEEEISALVEKCTTRTVKKDQYLLQ